MPITELWVSQDLFYESSQQRCQVGITVLPFYQGGD